MGRFKSHFVSQLQFFMFFTDLAFLLAASDSDSSPSPQQSAAAADEAKMRESVSFRPSIAVTVGVLTIIFSITFLLLLYAKHCKNGDSNGFSISDPRLYPPITAPKNSGVNRAVIESLPIFRFASLRGQKEGLECAVCLNRFESSEVLRLLPKCKHAFHVECVDTWLDAHSTCPLCRYRVDPEDILLVEDNRHLMMQQQRISSGNGSRIPSTQQSPREAAAVSAGGGVSRVSGRHSFAGNSIEVIVEKPRVDTTSFIPRRSLDSWSFKKKKNQPEIVSVGCFDHRPRKDGMLLLSEKTNTNLSAGTETRRLEHRIIISGVTEIENPGLQNKHRWSDVYPPDLLYLQSETILSDSRRIINNYRWPVSSSGGGGGGEENGSSSSNNNDNGRDVIKGRSVSEITGLGRFRSNEQQREYEQLHRRREERKRQAGAVSRWLAWISQSQFSK